MSTSRLTFGGSACVTVFFRGICVFFPERTDTKCLRSNTAVNVVAATFEGLKALRTPEEVARTRGKSVDEIVG